MNELFSLGLDKIESKPFRNTLTKKQVMEQLNVSHQTLHTYMTKKGLKYYKMGYKQNSKVLFKQNDVHEWMERFLK